MNQDVRSRFVIDMASMQSEAQNMDTNQALSAKQHSIIPIAAFTANGDMEKLRTALHEGLDAGLTVYEIKEILVQMYAYAGFPHSLNGIRDSAGPCRGRHPRWAGQGLGTTGSENSLGGRT